MSFILSHPAKKLFQKISEVFATSRVGRVLGRIPLAKTHAWQQNIRRTQYQQYYASRVLSLATAGQTVIELENFFITPVGVVVFYHATNPDGRINVYVMLFELAEPDHALWPSGKELCFVGMSTQGWQFESLVKQSGQYTAVWSSVKFGKKELIYPNYVIKNEFELKHPFPILFKPVHNPILGPHPHNDWEAFCTFNPAAVYVADKVHLLYRAQGHDYVSQIGYASSSDGVMIDERLNRPVYWPTESFEGASLPSGDPNNPFVSGGGTGGCEDPRATIIDGRLYMTYVAYNGWDHPRIALTSIALTDFLAQRFFWEKPILISAPGVVDKSACIFPEKINGKYVILHRVYPDILIDYADDLNFTGKTYLQGHAKISPRSNEWWDSRKIGAGAPPIKTDDGWLLIYQAVDDKDASQYKVGAMLLDLNDPSKVLFRSSQPILEPKERYENFGFKAGVVYPCGAVVKDNTLFVYYGGADSFVCVATANLTEFMHDLKQTGKTHFNTTLLAIT